MRKRSYINPSVVEYELKQALMVKIGSEVDEIEKGQDDEGEDPNGVRIYRWQNFDDDEEDTDW